MGSLSDKGLRGKEREEGSRQMEQYVQKTLELGRSVFEKNKRKYNN